MIGFELETSDLVLMAPANTLNLHEPIIEGSGFGHEKLLTDSAVGGRAFRR